MIPHSKRKIIFRRDGGKCIYCHRKLGRRHFTVDHIHPKSKGGSSEESNLVLSCHDCNQKKGNNRLSNREMERVLNLVRINTLGSSVPIDDMARTFIEGARRNENHRCIDITPVPSERFGKPPVLGDVSNPRGSWKPGNEMERLFDS